MANFRDFYGSKTLSATALGKRKLKGKILAIEPETMTGKDGKNTTRLCMTVSGEEKLIPLNATNAERLGKKWGEDFTKWKGRQIAIATHKTTFGKDEVDGLLITPL